MQKNTGKVKIMKICVNCGAELNDMDGYCSRCGMPQAAFRNGAEPVPETGAPRSTYRTAFASDGSPVSGETASAGSSDSSGKLSGLLEQKDHTASFRPEDVEENKLFCILSYLGILCLIPLLSGNKSPYLRFHVNQGLVLFLSAIILNMARALLAGLWIFGKLDSYVVSPLFTFMNVLMFALTVIGISNVVRGKAAELPLIGKIRLI